MYCKMDLDDAFVMERMEPRTRACACKSVPVASSTSYGCVCPVCRSECRECPGFGYAAPPKKRVHQILSRVRGQIRRRMRIHGRPPGFVRLTFLEIRQLLRKRSAEEADHWIRDFVEPGPPLRVYDVIVVTDRRREE